MRIVFLLPSLEPGRTGVGDYVQGLATACRERGHECALIALHDPFVSSPIEDEDGNVLRLPAGLPWQRKQVVAGKLLQRFRPDWISLHYVPYGFHRKGLTPLLGRRLRALVSTTPVEIMFHEIWIGHHIGASWKHRCWGILQRWSVQLLLAALRPEIVHTTNATYAGLFRNLGLQAGVLQMFGAIPLAAVPAVPNSIAELPFLGPQEGGRAKWLVAGMFGTLHPEWPAEPLMGYLIEAARRSGRQLALVSVGRIGRGEGIWARMEQDYPGVRFARLGEKSTEAVSALLSAFDLGLATSPWSLIGKSSTVAAMLEHGLPVIVNRDEIHYAGVPRNEPQDELLILMDDRLPERITEQLPRGTPASRLPKVADAFLQSMTSPGRTRHGREQVSGAVCEAK